MGSGASIDETVKKLRAAAFKFKADGERAARSATTERSASRTGVAKELANKHAAYLENEARKFSEIAIRLSAFSQKVEIKAKLGDLAVDLKDALSSIETADLSDAATIGTLLESLETKFVADAEGEAVMDAHQEETRRDSAPKGRSASEEEDAEWDARIAMMGIAKPA
jgi:hypothetical protein